MGCTHNLIKKKRKRKSLTRTQRGTSIHKSYEPGQLQTVDGVRSQQRPIVLHVKHTAVAGHVLPVLPGQLCDCAVVVLLESASLNEDRLGRKACKLHNDVEDLDKGAAQVSLNKNTVGLVVCILQF